MVMTFFRDMFKDKVYFKTLLVIALPIVLQNLIASSLNMLDTIMVGMLGEAEIAAVGIGNQVFLLFNVIVIGLGSGCGIFIAQYWGKEDVKNIRRVMGICLISASVIAFAFTGAILLFSKEIVHIFNIDPNVIKHGGVYLKVVSISYIFTAITFSISNASRSIERAISPMVISFLALVSNGILNYIFIFGKLGLEPMGVKGAALGTVAARAFEAVALTLYVIKTNKVLLGSLHDLLDLSKDFVKNIYNTVSHVILNEAAWAFGMVIYSIIYGRMGTRELASIQIYNTISNFFTVIMLGTANASVVMIGKQIGRGDEEQAKRYGHQFVVLAIIIGMVISVSMAVSTKHIVNIFDVSDEVKHYTTMILYVVSAILTIRYLNVTMVIGVLRGGGDAKYGLFVDWFSMYFVGIPLAIVGAFVLKLPVYWVVALICSEELVKLFLVVKRLKSGNWIKTIY